jgi:hypothetical protein
LVAGGDCNGPFIQLQLHFDLLASTKLLTEVTTLDASVASAAIWLAEGLAESDLTALSRESTDDLTALVWLGKSVFAELTYGRLRSCAVAGASDTVPAQALGAGSATQVVKQLEGGWKCVHRMSARDRPFVPAWACWALQSRRSAY